MKVSNNDIFNEFNDGDIICPTTNGIVTNVGKLVMGAGNAKEFRDKFVGVDVTLGKNVSVFGNVPSIGGTFVVDSRTTTVVSFPTKYDYRDMSSISLIENSAKLLVKMADHHRWNCIRICAPGVGLGGLTWETVYSCLSNILDDRFIVHKLGDIPVINELKVIEHKPTFAIIIAGSRGFDNYLELEKVCDYMLSNKLKEGYSIVIISGTAKGADQLGEVYAKNKGFSLIRMPAEWDKFGKRAGYIRNKAMAVKASTFNDCGCVAFRVGNSSGTTHMIDICKDMSIKVLVKDY